MFQISRRFSQQKVSLKDRVLQTKSAQEKMVEGSAWLTAGSFFSRILGVIYIIPWMSMMGAQGDNGNALFAVGYGIYALFLQISTAGFPDAMSKLVAYHNSRGEYKMSWNLFKRGLYFMIGAGVLFGALMYTMAPILARGTSVSVEEGIAVIRSLVPAVIIIPSMSLIRGYYQGYNDMAPSAISQFIEQCVRIAYMLLLTFIIMQLIHGHYSQAIVQSTFAAFVGALFSLGYLLNKLWQDREDIRWLLKHSEPMEHFSTMQLFYQVLKESIPIVIISSGIQLAFIIDQYTFPLFARDLLHLSEQTIRSDYALFGFNTNKIITIIISLAISQATTSIPLLASQYAKQQKSETRNTIRKNLGLYAFVMFPAAFGMAVVAEPMYSLFYRYNPLGIQLLVISCIMSIILGAYTVLSTMLQAIQRKKEAIIGLLMGLIVKIVWQPVMILLFQSAGPLWSTCLGFTVASVYMIFQLQSVTHFDVIKTGKDIARVAVITLLMSVAAKITLAVCSLVLSPERKFTALLLLIIVAAVGGIVYVVLALKFRIADDMIGKRSQTLRAKLKFIK